MFLFSSFSHPPEVGKPEAQQKVSDTDKSSDEGYSDSFPLTTIVQLITKAKRLRQLSKKYSATPMPSRYFECLARIQLLPNPNFNPSKLSDWDDSDVQFAFIPTITYRYPPERFSDDQLIPYLCYPDFVSVEPDVSLSRRQFFMITLTNELGNRKFSYCVKYSLAKGSIPEVLIMISPVFNRNKYFAALDMAVNGLQKDFHGDFEPFIHTSFLLKPPAPAKLIFDANRKQSATETVAKLALSLGGVASTEGSDSSADLAEFLEAFGVDRTIAILSALLQERRVLLIGAAVPQLCRLTTAAMALIRPFEWPHTLVPVVPQSHLHFCCLPSPYLMGLLRQSASKLTELQSEKDLVIVETNFGYEVHSQLENYSKVEGLNSLPMGQVKLLRAKLTTALKAARQRDSFVEGMSLECFIASTMSLWFKELIGHIENHFYTVVDGDKSELIFDPEVFIGAVSSKSHQQFLSWFVETGIFQIWKDQMMEMQHQHITE